MERGYLGARTFEMTFPGQTQAIQQQSPFQQTGKFEGYDLGNDPLAVREKLTDDVFNAKGQLEAFVKDALARGIDPFQPDYSQEGGGLAFKTFQKAQANLMYAANALKLQKEFDEREREAKMRGDIRYKSTYDPTKDLSAEMNPDDVYYSTKLDPRTVANNQRTGQNYYTQQDVNAVNRATYDPTRQAVANSYTGEEQQYQLGGVLPATKETSYQQMIDRSGGRGDESNPEVEVLRKVTNLIEGVASDYKPVTKGGKTLLENTSFSNESIGEYFDAKGKRIPMIIKRWLTDPETGEITLQFENDDVPDQVLTGKKADEIAAKIIANNPRYGTATRMYDTARKLGYLDNAGFALNDKIVRSDAKPIKEKLKSESSAKNKEIKQKYDATKKQIQDLRGGFFELPTGDTLTVKKHFFGDKYYIDGWENLFSNGTTEDFEKLTADEVLNILDDFGFFNQFLSQPTTSSAPEIDPDI